MDACVSPGVWGPAFSIETIPKLFRFPQGRLHIGIAFCLARLVETDHDGRLDQVIGAPFDARPGTERSWSPFHVGVSSPIASAVAFRQAKLVARRLHS